MAHGFTGVRDMQLDPPAQAFVAAGYRVVVFDYRHFGDSPGEPRQLLDLKRQYADWDAAIAYARGCDGVDARRIVLWGTSFAGGHVLDAAARTDGVAAVIAQAPFVDGRAMALSLLRRYPQVVLRLQATAVADQLGALLHRRPRYVPVTCPAGGRAALPAPHVWESLPSVVPSDSTWRNEVAARILLRVGIHRPIRRVHKIRCPLLLQILRDETVLPTKPVFRAAKRAPHAELISYSRLDHFDVYVGSGFQRLITDQLAFLKKVAPAREA
jgi:pimeloyl-ACP methyl ester carboxylesterase